MSSGEREEKLVVRDLRKVYPPARRERRRARGADVDGADSGLDAAGGIVAVRDVSFTVRAGETFVVMGLSGSGKSTLIRCINRLVEPTRGQVRIDGEDVAAAAASRLREIRLTKAAMVFQHFALFPHRTVVENVEYGLKIRGVPPAPRRERALEMLAQVGLDGWGDALPNALSGGMQQRVGLARALAVDPDILLMDEPFSALDPLIRRDMQRELIALQRRARKTIVFITHDLHEALTLGDRVAIMRAGSFVQVGTPQDIVAAPGDEYVESFTRDVDRARVFTARDVMKPPVKLPHDTADADAASRRLRESGARGLHVVDAGDVPQGLVLAADLADNPSASGSLARAMRREFPRAAPSAFLAELYADCAEGLPIAVVDDAGRLLGTIEPLEVLAAVAGRAGAPTGPASGRAVADEAEPRSAARHREEGVA